MKGFTDLVSSERGAIGIAVLVLATALLIFNKITDVQWISVIGLVSAALITSKTITTTEGKATP